MPSGSALSPSDLDNVTRTVMAEAGSDPTAQLAVASVVANRLAAGGYGNTPSAVVRAPHQFEVWQDGSAQRQDPTSPSYGIARQIASDALSGAAPDPTGGATHFFSPSGQTARGRSGPAWAGQGQGLQIGGNVFFAPNGPVSRHQQQQEQTVQPQGTTPNPDDVFSELMTNAQGNGASAAAPQTEQGSAATPLASVDNVFSELTAHAAQNVKSAPVASAGTPPAAAPSLASPPTTPTQGAMTGDAAAAMGHGVLDLPIVGPAVMGGVNRLGAVLRMATIGGTYADGLKHMEDFADNTVAAHPYANAAGNALGTGVAMAPMMAAAPAAFGIGAGGLTAGNVVAGAGTGAAIGAADAGVRSGGDPAAVMKGGLVGGAFGAAGPVVGQGIGYGANKLLALGSDLAASARDGISASARNQLMDAVNRDGPQAVTSQLQQLGPNGMLADTGSAVQGLAQGTAVRPGGASLIQAIKDRAAGSQARIRQAVDDLGPSGDPQTVTDNILAERKAQDNANYGAVRETAPPVDVSRVVKLIDQQLGPGGAEGAQKTALQNLRGKLVTSPAAPEQAPGASSILDATGNPVMSPGVPAQPEKLQTAFNNLHNIRQEIDGLIDNSAPGLGVERGSVNRQQGSLQSVRGALDDALKTQVPGMAEADAASAALAKQAQAVKDGVNTLDSGKTAPTPQRFIDDFNDRSPEEQKALATGLLGEIGRRVGVNRNDLGAMRNALQGEEGWNTDKMAAVLGDKPVNKLVAAVNREGDYGNTFNKVVGNAQTAFRTESAKGLDRASPFGLDADLSKISTPGIVMQGAKSFIYNPLIKMLATTDTTARDAELAKILGSTGPARDEFVNKLFQAAGRKASVPAWAGALSRSGNLLMSGGQDAYQRAR